MFWRAVGRWAILAIAVPVVAVIFRKIGESVERRRGPTRMSHLLRRGASGLEGLSGRGRRRAVAQR